jgi:hypothetical protein
MSFVADMMNHSCFVQSSHPISNEALLFGLKIKPQTILRKKGGKKNEMCRFQGLFYSSYG